MFANPNFNGYTLAEKNDKWHDMNEITNTSTDVIFMMKDGELLEGEIVIEMSGAYYYSSESGTGWISPDDIKQWKYK